MGIGWLIAAGIIGAALASSSNDSNDSRSSTSNTVQQNYYTNVQYVLSEPSQKDYGSRVPIEHKRCNNCSNTDVSVYVKERTSGYVKLLFKCKHCGRGWTKKYFI